jgi:hypothetical protein
MSPLALNVIALAVLAAWFLAFVHGQPNNKNETIAIRLKSRKQLNIHHHTFALSDTELLMYYNTIHRLAPHRPATAPADRMLKWVRRVRLWLMGRE